MSIVVDVVFVLIATVLFPTGEFGYVTQSYQTRNDCMSNRAEMLESAKRVVQKNNVRAFVSECVATPVGEEITR